MFDTSNYVYAVCENVISTPHKNRGELAFCKVADSKPGLGTAPDALGHVAWGMVPSPVHRGPAP